MKAMIFAAGLATPVDLQYAESIGAGRWKAYARASDSETD